MGLDSLAVGSSDPKCMALLKGPQSRRWTSFIEAITANGRVLKLGTIFKGKKTLETVVLGRTLENSIASTNGWTDNHISVEWLKTVYLPQSQPANESDARLLILHGHGSHATARHLVIFIQESLPIRSRISG